MAALSSAISLLEVVVTACIDRWGWSRGRAALLTGGLITVLGVPSALDLNFLDAMDKLTGNFLLLVGGFFTAILVGWRIFPEADAELAQGQPGVAAGVGRAPALRRAGDPGGGPVQRGRPHLAGHQDPTGDPVDR